MPIAFSDEIGSLNAITWVRMTALPPVATLHSGDALESSLLPGFRCEVGEVLAAPM
ncbi:MAG: hypothetical protein HW416_1151 [Chloroflexi bacterium]|nr:hypothetical protein [Chloroflexota bacterium]